MKQISIMILGIIITGSMFTVYAIDQATAQEKLIPDWIKGTASFWINDDITDSEFIQAIEFMVNNGIIKIPMIQNLENELSVSKNKIIELETNTSELKTYTSVSKTTKDFLTFSDKIYEFGDDRAKIEYETLIKCKSVDNNLKFLEFTKWLSYYTNYTDDLTIQVEELTESFESISITDVTPEEKVMLKYLYDETNLINGIHYSELQFSIYDELLTCLNEVENKFLKNPNTLTNPTTQTCNLFCDSRGYEPQWAKSISEETAFNTCIDTIPLDNSPDSLWCDEFIEYLVLG